MAQAKKSKQEDEPGGPMSPEQVGEQARALNEQIVETATKIGQDALQDAAFCLKLLSAAEFSASRDGAEQGDAFRLWDGPAAACDP